MGIESTCERRDRAARKLMTDVTTNAVSTSRRLRLRFSLRTLLLVMLVAGAALGWLGNRYQEHRRQQQIGAMLEQAGGMVRFRVKTLGIFHEIVHVEYAPNIAWVVPEDDGPIQAIYSPLDDEILHVLTRVPSLRYLALREHSIDDEDLHLVSKCQSLEILDLTNTPVTDAGIVQLKSLTKLKELDLTQTQVTEAGIAELQAALPELLIYDD